MEELYGLSAEDMGQSLCSDQHTAAAASPGWAFLHKAITAMVMGFLMSAAGALLFLLHSVGVIDVSCSVASACLSIGLMFVVVGLVWIPILKQKHRRKQLSQGLEVMCGVTSACESRNECDVFVSDDVTEASDTVRLEWLLLITTCAHCTLNSHSRLFHARTQLHSPAALVALGLLLLLVWRISSAIMSTPVQIEPVMEKTYKGVGRCKCSFWFAVAHDILGVLIIMVGVFGGLVIHDVFIYGGAIIIFLSLIWWVFWYSGNIDVPPEELEDDVGLIKMKNRRLSRAVRRVSDRISNRIRNSFRKKDRTVEEVPSGAPGPSNSGTDVAL
ncbi:hypothetical protein GOODEAATRI_021404 [Goodea atripinnis]|uniref:Uncharacterized protein n=1 Tax=Goodea atripinnis TaxID=208336 RepID=A0ABV0NWX4_9TELE